MKKKSLYKWIFVIVLFSILVVYGFSFTVNEGTDAIVTRFGAYRKVITDAGLYFKLPWPFEKTYYFDARKNYLDSGFSETLTKDKKNVIIQTYVVWKINDPLLYFKSVGSKTLAEKYLNDMVTNSKNAVMGNYELSSIVSTDSETIKIDEIKEILVNDTNENAVEQYGIEVLEIGIKRLGLPDANMQSVFEQMKTERQQYISQLIAEGEQDANEIVNETNVQVAQILSDGKQKAAEIKAETEKEVAEIYAEAYREDPDFYEFLRKLDAVENSVDMNTTLILRIDDEPFNVLRWNSQGEE